MVWFFERASARLRCEIRREMEGFGYEAVIAGDPEAGVGACRFTDGAGGAKRAALLTTQAAQTDALTGGSETILLAEDDGAVCRLAREVLTKWGYTVLEARDGNEALAVAARHQGAIDILIADVIMPGLGGLALAAKLALDDPAMRVVYTSGYADDVMLRQGAEGDLRLLPKPFLPHDLVGIVREVLDAPTPPGAEARIRLVVDQAASDLQPQ